MKYFSPFFGPATLKSIKKRVLRELRRKPCPIDPTIVDLMIDINKLPFVIHTIESCSGHVDCETDLPRPMEKALKYYWYTVTSRFLDTGKAYNLKMYKHFMQPQFQLMAYFITKPVASRLRKKYKAKKKSKRVIFRNEFLDAISGELLDEFLAYAKEQDSKYTDYVELMEGEDVELFEALADAFYKANPNLSIYQKLQDAADKIEAFDPSLRYCDWAWGAANEGVFLDILYVKSEAARDFHRQLSRLFKHRKDKVLERYEEDMNILTGMIEGGPDAICIACYESLDECECYEEDIFDDDWSPETELQKLAKQAKIQFHAAYWKSSLKQPLTVAGLDVFWDKVRDLVTKFSKKH